MRLQQAVHASQDREEEDDFAIVGRSDLATHALGSSPDQVGIILEQAALSVETKEIIVLTEF